MTPAARYAAAIEILDRTMAGAPAERELTSWARSNRFAGSKDRAAVRDIVFDGLRNLRSYAHISGLPQARGVLVGRVMAMKQQLGDIFNGVGYAPSELTSEELALVNEPKADMPRAVALDIPDWLEPEFNGDDDYSRLKARAPIDLRVNLKKTTVENAAKALLRDGIETDVIPDVLTALRVRGETRKIPTTASYLDGHIELQDAGSQALVHALDLPDGGTVLDYCAGGGGKTLAMGSSANSATRFSAYDIDQNRLKALSERAKRAGVKVERLSTDPVKAQKKYDLVVLDVPCSGSGAWRRNPDAKWKLTADRLAELTSLQSNILENSQPLIADGGRLAYMTCSLFECENKRQVAEFIKKNPLWVIDKSNDLRLEDDTDGFHYSILRRK